MKRIYGILIIFVFSFVCFYGRVSAETYFTNKNGVEFTEKEYNFLVELYDNLYVNNMTEEKYNKLAILNLNENELQVSSFEDGLLSRATSISSPAKRVSIGSSCVSTSCAIIITATWLQVPNVRSYDNIGARFTGTVSRTGSITTEIDKDSGVDICSNYKETSKGIGCTFKLDNSSDSFYITQMFAVTGSGYVYGSYQHAMTTVTLSQAMSYSFSASGIGSVFLYSNESIREKYDAMSGVYLSVSA